MWPIKPLRWQQARQKAMANAGSLATELAKTAGVKLGEIQTISYSDNSPLPYYGMGGGGALGPECLRADPARADADLGDGQRDLRP